ncbi:hypothetical protein C9439_00820 [archaeon SCG-AAA382B04]|nr:hypothetical protein C9439_00820 [archaeon SCG-AAA382B04]
MKNRGLIFLGIIVFSVFILIISIPMVSGQNFSNSSNQTSLDFQEIRVSSKEVDPNEEVIVRAMVINNGGERIEEKVEFRVEGEIMDKKNVSLESEEWELVSFFVRKEDVGKYNVSIDGLSESFIVTLPQDIGVSSLTLESKKILSNETVKVLVEVENEGGRRGEYNLQVVVEKSRPSFGFSAPMVRNESVALDSGEKKEFSFEFLGFQGGNYTVSAGGKEETLKVEATDANENGVNEGINIPGFSALLAIVVLFLTSLFLKMKKEKKNN